MKNQNHFLTLLLIFGSWLGASAAQTATAGTVVAWGENASGQLDVPAAAQSGVTAIAAGGIHYYGDRTIGYSLALKDDGSVVGWGTNSYSSIDSNIRVPQVPIAAQSGVVAISAADFHAAALKNDGTVVAWGRNNFGQVTGTPTTNEPYSAIASPVVLHGQVLTGVMAIAAGGFYTVALKNDGTVVAWGENHDGQVTGTSTFNPAIANPVTLGGQVLSGVTAIAASYIHTVALLGAATPLPFLSAKPNRNEIILFWPTNEVGFTLQSTTNLAPPVTWIDYSNPYAILGTQFMVTNTALGSARFYRLKR